MEQLSDTSRFEEIKHLIESNSPLDMAKITININYISKKTEEYFSETSELEFGKIITTQQTLLHIAIKSRNFDAVRTLLSCGAKVDIPYSFLEERRQREKISKQQCGPWQYHYPIDIQLSPLQLAYKTNLLELVVLIQEHIIIDQQNTIAILTADIQRISQALINNTASSPMSYHSTKFTP